MYQDSRELFQAQGGKSSFLVTPYNHENFVPLYRIKMRLTSQKDLLIFHKIEAM
jgi:hypothetical protein